LDSARPSIPNKPLVSSSFSTKFPISGKGELHPGVNSLIVEKLQF
jgi:hypothetical protein